MRTLLMVVCLSGLAAAAPASDPVGALVAKELGPTQLGDDLRELTDTIGGRPTGSAALDQGIDWALEKFRAGGLENVHAESYPTPRTWVPKLETAEIVTPRYDKQAAERNQLRVAAMPMSPSTPAAGIEADVYDLGGTDAAKLVAAKAKGKWVLVHGEPMKSLDDLFKEYFATPPVFAAAKKAGAVGVLWVSNRASRLLYRHNITLDGSMGSLPGALIEHEGGERVVRLLASGKPVRVRVAIAADVVEKATARNVVAEVKGRDKPDEVVVLGAHFDSWDLGRGALDNGCNAVMVIDVARHMMQLAKDGVRPRRTIRFVLYSGEELALLGSWQDVRLHRQELDKVDAMLTWDVGTGRTTGFILMGRTDIVAGVDRAVAAVAGLGPFTQVQDAFIGTDNYDYLLEGVPTLVANQDGAPYLADYHAESDTLDKVDVRELAANSAIAAAVTWGIADDPKRLGARQSRREVEALVKATKLDEQMKAFALWDDFVAGRRGRAK